MRKDKSSVLFISHDASRAGAPIILLNFIEWFKKYTEIPFSILLGDASGNRGELIHDFNKVSNPYIFNSNNSFIQSKGPIRNAINHYISQFYTNRTHIKNLKNQLSKSNTGLIYSNTIVNGHLLDFLSFLDCPVITHVHELDFWITHRAGLKNLELIKKNTTHYIAVSQAVKDNLVENYNIAKDKVDIVYEFIPTNVYDAENISIPRNEILKELNIPENAFIVGGSGTIDWRKAPDLFIQLARATHKLKPTIPTHFIWVGGKNKGIEYNSLQYDIVKTGLENHIHFVGTCENPVNYYATFDLFAMVSREDPCPLVMLESGSLGIPVLCFADSGGAQEFVEDDSGIISPYMDIESMADNIVDLQQNPDLRNKLGSRAAEKVQEKHKLDKSAHKVVKIINRFL